MSTNFVAGFQALGYLFQIRYALYSLLNSDEDTSVAIELLEDVSLSEDQISLNLIQLKHHSKKSVLSDNNPDFWKTIRNWSIYLKEGKIDPSITTLTLATTAKVSPESVLCDFIPSRKINIDENEIIDKLILITKNSNNNLLKTSFDAFLDLSPSQRKTLISIITILDESPNIADTVEQIKKLFRITVRKEYIDPLYERLEGWWFDRVARHIQSASVNPITFLEVQSKISDLNHQFRPESLPIDYLDSLPSYIDPDNDARTFVIQLKIIAINNERIKNAIIDYYRAFEQRSRWVRENLIINDELEKYEKKLVDEWKRYQLRMQDNTLPENADEEQLKKFGRTMYDWMEDKGIKTIRPDVSEEYVWRGSYHMLADQLPPAVWWHPKFVERLQELLNK